MTLLTTIPQTPPWLGKATAEERRSVRSIPDAKKDEGAISTGPLSDWVRVFTQADGEPPYYSYARDTWLRDFLYKPGNDLLLGTISTLCSRVSTSKWFLEGPERTVNIYQKALLQRAGFGTGWSFDVMRGSFDFLTQDKGWSWERIRMGRTDRTGGALGLACFDSAHIEVNRDPEWPAKYIDEKKEPIPLHKSQVIRIVDMPSPSRELRGIGLSALSRALTTARILADIARYERERLSDLPPAGLLLLNNMAPKQWEDVTKRYDTRQQQQGNDVWRDLMVAFGLNPAVPLKAELLEFSQMPEHFNKQEITEIAIYSFALAFNTDPREIWPVSAGVLGTATEANIQHMKAKAKGHGLILSLVERAMNDGLTLPPTVSFVFDYQDVEEDERAARIRRLNAEFISILAGTVFTQNAGRTPIISQQEARQWLIEQNYFTEDQLATPVEEEAVAEDIEIAKAKLSSHVDMGPHTRIWSDGRIERLERRAQMWHGWQPKAEATDTGNVLRAAMKQLGIEDSVPLTQST